METELPDIIKSRKILPEIIKEDIKTTIFFNCIIFIMMMFFTLIINISFNKLYLNDFENYIDIIQMFCCVISVVILEVAYRKDSGKIGLHGIEFLIFSICILFVPYMYISKDKIYYLRDSISSFAIYYFLKSLIMSLHTRNQYLRDNISDVKEIVKEDKKGYLDEESVKTLKEQKIENERKKKLEEEKQKENKKQKSKDEKVNNKSTSTKESKSNQTKKSTKNVKTIKKKGGKNND